MLSRLDKVLITVEEGIMAIGMLVASLVLFANIVLRYVFLAGLSWAEEYVRFSIMWIVFVGSGAVARRQKHLSVSALVDSVRPLAARIVTIVNYIVTVAFTAFMTVEGWRLTMDIRRSGQLTPSMLIPAWLVYVSIPIGGALMTLRFLQLFARGAQPQGATTEAEEWEDKP